MIPMSPTDAQLILDGAEASGENLNIGYRRALETIAGMAPEYMAFDRADEDEEWHQVTPWSPEWPSHIGRVPDPRFDRVIRRYVTTEEEA